MADLAWETAEAERVARRAAELGKEDALALATAGIAIALVVGDLDEGSALIDRALVLNPNLAWGWLFSGWVRVWGGEPDIGIERVSRALRLNPYDPHIFSMYAALACGHLFARRYADAATWAESAMREHPTALISTSVAAASNALAGQMTQSEKALARLRQLGPSLLLRDIKDLFPIRRPEDAAILTEGLRKAGLPE